MTKQSDNSTPSPVTSLSEQSGKAIAADERGISGLRGIDHIGLTVLDIDQAIDFLVDVLGCETFYEVGPIQVDDGDSMQTHLNVHPRSVVQKIKFLRCKHGSNIELFEYIAPDQITTQPKNSDVGGHHLAFYVDDIDDAVAAGMGSDLMPEIVDHFSNQFKEMRGEQRATWSGNGRCRQNVRWKDHFDSFSKRVPGGGWPLEHEACQTRKTNTLSAIGTRLVGNRES